MWVSLSRLKLKCRRMWLGASAALMTLSVWRSILSLLKLGGPWLSLSFSAFCRMDTAALTSSEPDES